MSKCECGCGEEAPRAKKTRAADGIRKGDQLRFIAGHQNAINARANIPANRDRYIPQDRGYTTPCWIWQGPLTTGYSRFSVEGRLVLGHRWFYERANGAIPAGLVLDHLCRQRACVNPDHLEPVTARENILRGEGMGARFARRTHCAAGHPFTEDNTYVLRAGQRAGSRVCRTCKREQDRNRRASR